MKIIKSLIGRGQTSFKDIKKAKPVLESKYINLRENDLAYVIFKKSVLSPTPTRAFSSSALSICLFVQQP